MLVIYNKKWNYQIIIIAMVIISFLASCNQEFSFTESRYEFKPTTKLWIPISLPHSFTMVSDDGRSEIYLLTEFKMNYWLEKVDNFKKEYFKESSFEYETENSQRVFDVSYSALKDNDLMVISYNSDSFTFWSMLFFDENINFDLGNIYMDSLIVGGVVYHQILRLKNGYGVHNEVLYFARGIGLIRYNEMNGVIWDRQK